MTQSTTIDNTDIINTAPKDIPIEHILEYRAKNLSHAAIGKLVGCSAPNVTRRLAAYKGDLERLDNHKKHGADILTLKSMKILDHITDDKLKDASAYQLTGMYGIIHQNERLKRDQSTANIAYKDVSSDVAALEAEIASLEDG